MTSYVRSFSDLDATDDDRDAFDLSLVCADADVGECDGGLTERVTAGGEAIYLCDWHRILNDRYWTGVLPALKAMAAADADRRTA